MNCVRLVTLGLFASYFMRLKYMSVSPRAFMASSDCPTVLSSLHILSIFSSSGLSTLLSDALVHDALREHLQLEQFTDELDETETLSLRLL